MPVNHSNEDIQSNILQKCPSGVKGLDEITFGGLPLGRPTLVCGSAGCGKTLFGMEFIEKGITEYNENGVYLAFEENEEELVKNFSSLGFDLKKHIRDKKLIIDYVYIERSEIEETGEYSLDGLFIRLGHAIDSIGAKRVVLDTIEALFTGFSNESLLRAELRRLFSWLKTKGVTAIITGERGENSLTRYGLEEYVADCVILLDHRIIDQIATRRLKIIKYRGSKHGTNEFPFLVDRDGISVLPITSLGLEYDISTEHISTGVKDVDEMFDNKGYYRASTVLISGSAGCGKTSFASHFIDAACSRGEKCIYFSFEESEQQILRNMKSIGLDLRKWVDNGSLVFSSNRSSIYGLEMHLVSAINMINRTNPNIVVFDPISNLLVAGSMLEAKAMLTRLIDFLKTRLITAILIDLSVTGSKIEETEVSISSLTDTWIKLQNHEVNLVRNRYISILKSRGMKHSNVIREFLITDNGIKVKQ